MDDNRAVAPVIGVVILFGFLILALSLYQVEIVPQQNAETEFQHSGEVRNDLVELRAGILQAGSIDQPQYQTVQLGTAYSTRTFTINPPSPAGTIRTTDPYPITISNNSGTPEGTITIPTRFIEYQPGYNELDRSPTWYDASVLYLDARDNGGGIAVVEDQALVDNGEVQITALQNEFRRSGTGRVTLELRPAENVTGNIPEGDLTVTIPTRLSGNEYWDDEFTEVGIYSGVDTGEDSPYPNGVYGVKFENVNDISVNTIGIGDEANNGLKQDVGPDGSPGGPPANGDALSATGDVTVGEGEVITGDIDAGGDVEVKEGGEVQGSISSGGEVTVKEGGEVQGSVDADGEVTVADVTGSITAGGDVEVKEGGEVQGSISSGRDVTVKEGGEVQGSVDADGEVTVKEGGEVQGEISEG
jgi:cytoskeletal protein CcmA (bactofilin family)